MSTACGRPQGGRGGSGSCGQGREGAEIRFFCGRHKWMAPYPPTFLHPYLFLKLVSFLEANRTKGASVGIQLSRVLYKYSSAIQYNTKLLKKNHNVEASSK